MSAMKPKAIRYDANLKGSGLQITDFEACGSCFLLSVDLTLFRLPGRGGVQPAG
jgi:hypothetical protein